MLSVFVLFCDEQSRIGIVVAKDEADAYVQLAAIEAEDDDLEDALPHLRKYWKVKSSKPVNKSCAVCAVTWDRSEAFNLAK